MLTAAAGMESDGRSRRHYIASNEGFPFRETGLLKLELSGNGRQIMVGNGLVVVILEYTCVRGGFDHRL